MDERDEVAAEARWGLFRLQRTNAVSLPPAVGFYPCFSSMIAEVARRIQPSGTVTPLTFSPQVL